MSDPDQHPAIRALLDHANLTPGPWIADGHEIHQADPITEHSTGVWVGETCDVDSPDTGAANAAFIAAARDLVPLLLAQVEQVTAERDSVYRERAHLVAHLAAIHPSHLGYTDPDIPTWPVLTVETPTGQMCWHINPTDLDLFGHVTWVDPVAIGWDGHTTEEKYQRLRELTSQDSAERLRRERATCRRCNTGDHDPCGQHLGAS